MHRDETRFAQPIRAADLWIHDAGAGPPRYYSYKRSNSWEVIMGELRSALDALAADDVHSLAPRQQLDRIAEILEARNRLDAQLARSVRAAELQQAPEDDGLKSMRSWLRGHGRLSPAAAGQL